jgi:hypothetical protein
MDVLRAYVAHGRPHLGWFGRGGVSCHSEIVHGVLLCEDALTLAGSVERGGVTRSRQGWTPRRLQWCGCHRGASPVPLVVVSFLLARSHIGPAPLGATPRRGVSTAYHTPQEVTACWLSPYSLLLTPQEASTLGVTARCAAHSADTPSTEPAKVRASSHSSTPWTISLCHGKRERGSGQPSHAFAFTVCRDAAARRLLLVLLLRLRTLSGLLGPLRLHALRQPRQVVVRHRVARGREAKREHSHSHRRTAAESPVPRGLLKEAPTWSRRR